MKCSPYLRRKRREGEKERGGRERDRESVVQK
jgi:hypothetical protein